MTAEQLPMIEVDDDLFAHIRPATQVRMSRVTCPVCDMPHSVPLDAPTRLCGVCGGDLDKAAAFVEARLTANRAACEEGLAAYVAAEQSLDDTTARRWRGFCTARSDARKGLDWAMYGKYPEGMLPKALEQRRATAREAWAAFERKLAVTLADADNPLVPMIKAEQTYNERLRQLEDQRTKWLIALQEIDVARHGDPLLVRS